VIETVAERVPVGVAAQQRALAFAAPTAAPRQRDRRAVDAAALQEVPARDLILCERLDHEVAPARVHPLDPHRLTRRK
jgi:hypothetical protein